LDRLVGGNAEQRELALVATVRIFLGARVAAVQVERNAIGELPVGIEAGRDGIGPFAVLLVVEVGRLADTLCHVDRRSVRVGNNVGQVGRREPMTVRTIVGLVGEPRIKGVYRNRQSVTCLILQHQGAAYPLAILEIHIGSEVLRDEQITLRI
jgi:hypothetical protein